VKLIVQGCEQVISLAQQVFRVESDDHFWPAFLDQTQTTSGGRSGGTGRAFFLDSAPAEPDDP
jgi:hypothetical protein